MDIEQVPDWRIYFAAEVDTVQGAHPGDVLIVLTHAKTADWGNVMFPKVSPYRLALSIAIRSSRKASALRKTLAFAPRPNARKVRDLELSGTSALCEFFEECMIAATFSYQALETYANQVIEEQLGEAGTFPLLRRGVEQMVGAAIVQREASTEEKIATVLPALVKRPFDKSGKLWQQFSILRQVRDKTIHLKTEDHRSAQPLDRDTIFYRLLNNRPRSYPETALGVMRHFIGSGELSWLEHAEAALAAKP